MRDGGGNLYRVKFTVGMAKEGEKGSLLMGYETKVGECAYPGRHLMYVRRETEGRVLGHNSWMPETFQDVTVDRSEDRNINFYHVTLESIHLGTKTLFNVRNFLSPKVYL